jgi:glycosyltransferase involved in cell wall biosynthesis
VNAFLDRHLYASRERGAFLEAVGDGDIILALGASWTHANFGASLRALKQRHGLRFALLVHDILPVTHPELVAASFRPSFLAWLDEMIATWDAVLTPSHNVARTLEAHLQAIGEPIPPISPIPFGFGFADSRTLATATPMGGEPYALFVSTIEIRKNHLLLYRVWERLIAKHGPGKVPKLVFAGRMGWDVEDLRQALATSKNLGGKIQIVSNMSDAQLARAYADCLFTLFPSFCEGWGLPVSESLFHGKLCIASNATSIPEIGGPAVDYFDPHNEGEAFDRIERVLFEPGYLESREAWIAENFRLPTWEGTAEAIVQALLGAPTSVLKVVPMTP